MSRLAYYANFLALPLILGVVGFYAPFSPVYYLAGLVLWTLAEYALHRGLFHHVPPFQAAHDYHHEHPAGEPGPTAWVSLPIFVLLYGILPTSLVLGFATGYFAYIVMHHAMHHWRIAPGHPLYRLKLRHAMHHRGLEANFGVTTTLWDRAFGTYRARL